MQPHGIRAFDAWDDVDRRGAGFGSVAGPQLESVCFVKGREEQRAIDVHQFHRIPASLARNDVLYQHGTHRRAVTLPQLGPAGHIGTREEERAADIHTACAKRRHRHQYHVFEERGAGFRAVALPESRGPRGRIVGGEE